MSIISTPPSPASGRTASPSAEVRTLRVSDADRRKWDILTGCDINDFFISSDLSFVIPKNIFTRIIVALFANYFRSQDLARNVESLIDRCCPIVTGSEAETINADDLEKLGHATPNIGNMQFHFATKKLRQTADATERTTLVQRENPVLRGISGQLASASSKVELAFNRLHREPSRVSRASLESGRGSPESGRASTVSADAISIPGSLESPVAAPIEEIVSAFTTVRTSLIKVSKEVIQIPVLTYLNKRLTAVIGAAQASALLKMNPATAESIRSLGLTLEQYIQVQTILEDVAPNIEQYKRAVEKINSGDTARLGQLNTGLGQIQGILARAQASYEALVGELTTQYEALDTIQLREKALMTELFRAQDALEIAKASLRKNSEDAADLNIALAAARIKNDTGTIDDLTSRLSQIMPVLEDTQRYIETLTDSILSNTEARIKINAEREPILARVEVLEGDLLPKAEASIAKAQTGSETINRTIVSVKADLLAKLQQRLFPIS